MIWLSLTILGFVLGVSLQQRVQHPLANPTLIATVLMVACLLLSHTPYSSYQRDMQPLTTLLSPAVVALAVPLYRQTPLLLRQWPALVVGGLCGTLLATGFDLLLPRLLHLNHDAQQALSTAAVTSPVALALAHITGAPPALAATLAVLSGLIAAVILPPFLTLLGIKAPLARGIAYGSVSHGVGTARAREEGIEQGVASSIGMSLGVLIVTAVVAAVNGGQPS